MPTHRRGFDLDTAQRALARRDRPLAAAMRRIGPLDVGARWRQPFDTVDVLARSILHQQLSGKAAATIVARLEAALESPRLHADTLARIDDLQLRACGVSAAKARALRDLARAAKPAPCPMRVGWREWTARPSSSSSARSAASAAGPSRCC